MKTSCRSRMPNGHIPCFTLRPNAPHSGFAADSTAAPRTKRHDRTVFARLSAEPRSASARADRAPRPDTRTNQRQNHDRTLLRTLKAKPRSDACQRGSANAQSNGKPLPAARTGGGDATHSRPHAIGDTMQPTTTCRPMTNRARPLAQGSTTKPHPAARTRAKGATQTVPTTG